MQTQKSCGAVVFKKNDKLDFLLLHYEGGHWDFVKGQIEPNESEKETVIRELKEETGITDAKFIGDFKEKISYYYRSGKNLIYKEVIFFLVGTSPKNKVKISFEHIGYKWLNYQEAEDLLTFKTAKKVLKKAYNYIKNKNNSK